MSNDKDLFIQCTHQRPIVSEIMQIHHQDQYFYQTKFGIDRLLHIVYSCNF